MRLREGLLGPRPSSGGPAWHGRCGQDAAGSGVRASSSATTMTRSGGSTPNSPIALLTSSPPSPPHWIWSTRRRRWIRRWEHFGGIAAAREGSLRGVGQRNIGPRGAGIASCGPGHVLVTSRDPHWREIAAPIEVDVFTRNESTALLHAHLPTLPDDHADQLADALGDLPLGLRPSRSGCSLKAGCRSRST